MNARRRSKDARAAAKRKAEQAKRAAEQARRAAEEAAREQAAAAARKAEEPAQAAMQRALVEAAHAKVREDKPLIEAMLAAAVDLAESRAEVRRTVIEPLWEGTLTGRAAAAAVAGVFQRPSMRSVAEEAAIRDYLTISIALAVEGAAVAGGSYAEGIAGGVGLGLAPPRADASAALFTSTGFSAGLSLEVDASAQLGVWLRSPQGLGQAYEETLRARIRADRPRDAFRDTIEAFDRTAPVPGGYWGLEVGLDADVAAGAGVYFDLRLPSLDFEPLFQGTTVSLGVGVGGSVNATAGKVVTYALDSTSGRP